MVNHTPKTVGGRVRMAREARKMTQQELAAAAGMNQGTLSTLETRPDRDVSARVILGLARVLGVSPQYLLWGPEAAPAADECAAIHDGLNSANRLAWLAAGRALLASQGQSGAPNRPSANPH